MVFGLARYRMPSVLNEGVLSYFTNLIAGPSFKVQLALFLKAKKEALSLTQELLSEWIFDGAMTATVRPGERVAIASHSSASLRRAKTAFSLPVLKPFSRMY